MRNKGLDTLSTPRAQERRCAADRLSAHDLILDDHRVASLDRARQLGGPPLCCGPSLLQKGAAEAMRRRERCRTLGAAEVGRNDDDLAVRRTTGREQRTERIDVEDRHTKRRDRRRSMN